MNIIAFEGLWGYPKNLAKDKWGHLGRLVDRINPNFFVTEGITLNRYFPWDAKGFVGLASGDLIIGYSYGGDTALSVTKKVTSTDLILFTIDLRPQWYRSLNLTKPPNVKRWINFYQHTFLWGTSCPEADENIKIPWTAHWSMCEHPTVEAKLKEVLASNVAVPT